MAPECRLCSAPLSEVFADLGTSPLANSLLDEHALGEMEAFYPLRAYVCGECLLVQLEVFAGSAEIFSEYAYFSSYSTTWLEHARRFAEGAVERFGLGSESRVVEVASNDGYLLRWFRDLGIPVLGIEPAANVARAAIEAGIPTVVQFFGERAARDLDRDWRADLLVANNVLPHVPDLHDFVAGLAGALKPSGVLTLEFQHLVQLVERRAFDTIYHEHFCYFSYLTVRRTLAEHGLRAFDVEELPTHGGSLRVYACRADGPERQETGRSRALLARETDAGYDGLATHREFAAAVRASKRQIVRFLVDQVDAGRRVAAYGAPAKAATLLTYCGVGPDLIEFTVDRNPAKQGRYLPGVRIPIRSEDDLRAAQPDVTVLLPWNLRAELEAQLAYVADWGGRLACRTPDLRLL